MKLLLDMYRSAPKEQRDKVQLMAAEKKSKSEVMCMKFVTYGSVPGPFITISIMIYAYLLYP